MDNTLNVALLFANAIITFICGGSIAYFTHTKKLKKHYLFLFWTLGFFLYGTEITLRALSVMKIIPLETNLFGVLVIFAFILFPIGLWSLSRRKHVFYMVTAILILISIFYAFYISGALPQETALSISPFFLYFPVAVTLLEHRRMFGGSLDRIIIGWFLLFLSNFLLPLNLWALDILAIFSKVIILIGIMDYDFIILVKNIRNGLTSHIPSVDAGYKKEGCLNLIKCSSNHAYQGKSEWVIKKIKGDLKAGIDNYIFCFQDTIPHKVLRSLKWIHPESVFIFLFSSNAADADKEFTVLPMGITEIGAALSEVIKRYANSDGGCRVFFMNLSVLIHAFDVYPCYSMLLNKMGELRAAGVELFAFIHPETHNDKTIVPLFTNISDEITEL